MDDREIPFLPYHALNEFMRPDFRQDVVRQALSAAPNLPENHHLTLDRLTRSYVKVPGFRNSSKAPLAARVRPTAEVFEKHPDMVAAILSAWAESRPELRQQVYDLLSDRGWGVLPPEADRTTLPGFIPTWPKDEDFEVLNEAYAARFPEAGTSTDDVSLMVVWISGRLPYQIEGEEDDEEDWDETEDTDADEPSESE